MLWILGAFVFGMMTPYMARRFAKFMPATFAGAIVELLRREKKLSGYRKNKLYHKFLWRSFMCGLLNSAITALLLYQIPDKTIMIAYVWIMVLLAEIDLRMFVLPDILTIPLLLIGISAAYISQGIISIDESVSGALIGYFLPVAVSLLIIWYRKDAFGGGDIKMLSAIGAWLGIEGLLYVIVIASILGLVWAAVSRQKSLAFGPMIAIAGIIVVFVIS